MLGTVPSTTKDVVVGPFNNTHLEEQHKNKTGVNSDVVAVAITDEVVVEETEETEEEEEDDDESRLKSLDLGPQFTLKEQIEKDKDDESLRKWKEQLLGSVDIAAVGECKEPEVKIQSLIITSPGRPDLVLPIPFTTHPKKTLFTLKEGSKFRMKFTFSVSNNIVSGLKYTNVVWKKGFRVDSRKRMLGTFSPKQELYTYEMEEETIPSGMFARGSYASRTGFIDDDQKCYLDVSYYFEIQKTWGNPHNEIQK